MAIPTMILGMFRTPLNSNPDLAYAGFLFMSRRKMFVGGLNGQTTPDNLKKYFEEFGEVGECMIMKDAITKRSRGFGFITFKESSSVDKVLKNRPHVLDGKDVSESI
jgi:RNA recognition motif-containing protein